MHSSIPTSILTRSRRDQAIFPNSKTHMNWIDGNSAIKRTSRLLPQLEVMLAWAHKENGVSMASRFHPVREAADHHMLLMAMVHGETGINETADHHYHLRTIDTVLEITATIAETAVHQTKGTPVDLHRQWTVSHPVHLHQEKIPTGTSITKHLRHSETTNEGHHLASHRRITIDADPIERGAVSAILSSLVMLAIQTPVVDLVVILTTLHVTLQDDVTRVSTISL
jgi:hypothetical protein